MFVMGVLAGLLHLRGEESVLLSESILPWSVGQPGGVEERDVSRRVDRNTLVLLSIVLLSILRAVIPSIPYLNIYTQLCSAHLQLVLMVGISREGGLSWIGWICR